MSKAWEGELFPKYVEWRLSAHGRTIFRIIENLIVRERQSREHYGMFALINDARFEYNVQTRDPDGFKISNSVAPYLAREFTANGTAPPGFFEIIGGTPEWFARWAKGDVSSNGAALDLARVPATAPVDVRPVVAPPRCPGTKDKPCGAAMLPSGSLAAPGFMVARCPSHGRVSIRWP